MTDHSSEEESFAQQRRLMVERQLLPRGISDAAVIQSLGSVPRHRFVSSPVTRFAYSDGPLDIGNGQTISQPYIVALMTQAAQCGPECAVLDVGTGSGYAAAVFSGIVKKVYSIERIASLAEEATRLLTELGYNNIEIKVGDGTLGWPEKGPFDAIVVAAAAPHLPQRLLQQLAIGGRLIIPIGDTESQNLICFHRSAEDVYEEKFIEHVRFVPLIGEEGW